MAKLFLTYTNSTKSQTEAQAMSSTNTYSVIFDEGRKSIWAQGKEYGYSSDTVTYASYVTTGTGKNLVAGDNVTLTNNNGSVTIASSYTNTTNVIITSSGSGNYVSGVSMTNSGDSASAHAITVTYSTLPTLSASGGTASSATLDFGDTFTVDTYTSVSDHQITYARKTYTLPTETQLSGGATASAGNYVSGVTVSGHKVTVAQTALPTLSVTGDTASANQYVSAISATGHEISVTKATLPTIGNGSIYAYIGRSHASSSGTLLGTANQTANTSTYITAEDLGITGVMNFLGVVASTPTTSTVTIGGKQVTAVKGDVVVVNGTAKEYLHSGTGTNPWIELGDETSFALKSTTISSTDETDGITATLGGTINSPTITLSGTPITDAINALDANFSYTNTTTSFISYSLTETDGKITAFTVNHDKLIDEINAKEAVTAAALTDINSSLNASINDSGTANGITVTLGGTVNSPTIDLSGTPTYVSYITTGTTSSNLIAGTGISLTNVNGHVTITNSSTNTDTKTTVSVNKTAGTGVVTGISVTNDGTNAATHEITLTYTSLATTSGTSATISSSNNKVLTNISQAANGKITYSYGSLPATAFGNQSISFSASGDVTGTASGATSLSPTLTIGDGKVTNTKLEHSSITIVDKSVALGGTMEPADFWGTL